jgi:TetR/AcrR family transcriptional regulator, ethionamide resistance regulator
VRTASPRPFSRDERRLMLIRVFGDVLERLAAEGQSFHDVKVQTLIDAAGISRATFYSYFEDKGDLLVAISEDLLDELWDSGQSFHSLPDDARKEDLRDAVRIPLAKYVDRHDIFRALVHLWHTDPRVAAQQQRIIDQTVVSVAEQIRRRQDRGALARDLDATRVATWLTWMLERGAYHLTDTVPVPDLDAWVDAVTDVIWRALYAGA